MRVMSFNVFCGGRDERAWTNRLELVLGQIKKAAPDTFGTQETHSGWMDFLCANLPEYGFAGVGREDGARDGEFAPVFYRRDKYAVLDSGTFWLSETPEVPSKGWDSACTRICTWALLRENGTGKEFLQLNTHLDHIGTTAMIEGAKLVAQKIAAYPGLPVICTGDFNVGEKSPAYEVMTGGVMGDAKFLAARADSGNTYTGFDMEGTKNNSPIDFIFVHRELVKVDTYKIMSELVDGKQPSDHYAIYADVEIRD
ncbi:MAG: endonuclease/exonuclease/phosphatase family protein [Oscillospiraceae bacterium]|nr:endonuclease/exonuclease/phosphatase family protein [Oscillospiraceae bacterium]